MASSKTLARKCEGRDRSPSLGIDTRDLPGTVSSIRKGFAFSKVTRFQKYSGLPLERISRVMQIPPRTLSRRQAQGRLKADESDRLLRLSRIFDQAVDLFEGNVSAARHWLESPQRGLGGEAPLDFATTEVGAREVENLIGRLEYGVFS
jgi:putative toxin-antitoxin system antitoxin component (TIGR02293 family)